MGQKEIDIRVKDRLTKGENKDRLVEWIGNYQDHRK